MEIPVVEQLIFLIVVGAVVAIIAHRLRIPYTVGLVVAGIVIAFLPLTIEVPFSKDFLFEVLLPPLIFEAALYIEWQELSATWSSSVHTPSPALCYRPP